jgi:AraC-like DNA-binding protein
MRIWQTIRAAAFGHHQHEHTYAAIVLSGSYEEAGDRGRFRVETGNVLLHERFEAHLNRFPVFGAVVLNLRLSANHTFLPGKANVSDLDSIVRAAEKNLAEAAALLLSTHIMRDSEDFDWPDRLAAAIIRDPSLRLSDWSETVGLTPWAVSRGFAQVFGISPSAFRARTRALQAWKAAETSKEPLAAIATRLAFADQSHMTRCVKEITGQTPHEWRSAANRFKT